MEEMNRFRLSVVIVNSLGVLLVFLYFSFIEREFHWDHQKTLHYVYVILTIGLISAIVALLMRHWQRPLPRVVNGNIPDRDVRSAGT
jgi:Kef-type K+ transport system membrane component KefB